MFTRVVALTGELAAIGLCDATALLSLVGAAAGVASVVARAGEELSMLCDTTASPPLVDAAAGVASVVARAGEGLSTASASVVSVGVAFVLATPIGSLVVALAALLVPAGAPTWARATSGAA